MKHIPVTRWALRCLLILALLGVVGPAAGTGARADSRSVGVWLTTADSSQRLARQADVAFSQEDAYNPLTIYVDERTAYQQIDGFGASLTDTSAWLLSSKVGDATRATVLRDLFDPTSGIGVSFLRQPMGASDYTKDGVPYSYDDMPSGQSDPALVNFSITHDVTYIIPMLQQALQLNPRLKIMANPWSPPGWMKANGVMTDANDSGSLLPSSYGPLAQYFVKFIQAYEARGIPIYAISPQNEPNYGAPDYPAMHLTPPEEDTLLKSYLGPAIAQADLPLKPKILGFDHNWGSLDLTNYFPFGLLDDPAVNPVLAGTAYHCYGGDPDVMTELHAAYPQKDIYETECSSTHSSPATRPTIKLLISSMRHWAKTVVLWNVAVDTDSGPRQGTGCTGCIGLVTVDQGTGTVSYTDDYYQLGHASKFVSPGAYRIASNSFDGNLYGPGVIEDVAFENPDGSKVLVAYNAAASSETFTVRWGAEAFDYTLPAGAISTFTWSGTQGGATTGPQPPGPVYYAVDAGGLGSGRFTADGYSDGGRHSATTAPIDTSAAVQPAPASVYQSERISPAGFTYTFPSLQPGASYGVRLHFAALDVDGAGQRRFDVSINGTPVLRDFDVYAEAGGRYKAIVKEFVAVAGADGTISVRYSPGSDPFVRDGNDVPQANGIEIVDPGLLASTPTATATAALAATPAATTTSGTPSSTATDAVPSALPSATTSPASPVPMPTEATGTIPPTSATRAPTPTPTPTPWPSATGVIPTATAAPTSPRVDTPTSTTPPSVPDPVATVGASTPYSTNTNSTVSTPTTQPTSTPTTARSLPTVTVTLRASAATSATPAAGDAVARPSPTRTRTTLVPARRLVQKRPALHPCHSVWLVVDMPRRPLADRSTVRVQVDTAPGTAMTLTVALARAITAPARARPRRGAGPAGRVQSTLYHMEAHLRANRRGHLVTLVRIRVPSTSTLAKPAQAILTIAVRTSCGPVTRSAAVSLAPPRKQPASHQRRPRTSKPARLRLMRAV